MSVVKPTRRLIELDAYRGPLALLTVTFHAYQPSSSDPGPSAFPVDTVPDVLLRSLDALLPMFFMLSGFAMMIPVARLVLAGKPLPKAGAFLRGRAMRLIPVYLAAVLIVWEVRYAGTGSDWLDLLLGVTFTQVWSSTHIFRLISPAWFLCVEWHWYVLFSLAGLPIARWAARLSSRAARLRRLAVIPLLLVLVEVAWRSQASLRGVPFTAYGTWFAPPAWAGSYALGCALGIWVAANPTPRPAGRLTRLGLGCVAFGGLITVMSHRDLSGGTPTTFYYDTGALCCFVALVGTLLHARDSHLRRLLRLAPIQWLAAISYGIYIWHDPILRGLDSIGVLPFASPRVWLACLFASWIAAIIAGWLSSRLVERPALRFTRLLKTARENSAPGRRIGEWADQTGSTLPGATLPSVVGAIDPAQLAKDGHLVVLILPDEPPPLSMPQLAGSSRLMREVRDWYFALRALDTDVIVVTRGTPRPADAERCLRERLPFPILRDPDGLWIASLGVPLVEAGEHKTSERATLLVRRGGEVVRWTADPTPDDEASLLARSARQLQPAVA